MPMISTSSDFPVCPRFSYIGLVSRTILPTVCAGSAMPKPLRKPLRQRFVDDRDARRARAVACGEAAAGEHGNIERREIVRIDALEPGADALLAARHANGVALPDAEQRHIGRDGRALDAGDRLKPLDRPAR